MLYLLNGAFGDWNDKEALPKNIVMVVAIAVIVLSVIIIVATALRNYLKSKKAKDEVVDLQIDEAKDEESAEVVEELTDAVVDAETVGIEDTKESVFVADSDDADIEKTEPIVATVVAEETAERVEAEEAEAECAVEETAVAEVVDAPAETAEIEDAPVAEESEAVAETVTEETAEPVEEELTTAEPVEAVPAVEAEVVEPVVEEETAVAVIAEETETKAKKKAPTYTENMLGTTEKLKGFYNILKNVLMSYVGVKSSITNKCEVFRVDGVVIAKIAKREKLEFAFASKDVKAMGAKYLAVISDEKMYEKTPVTFIVKSQATVKKLIDLITEDLAKEYKLMQKAKPKTVDWIAKLAEDTAQAE